MSSEATPESRHSVTPYLVVNNAAELIEFLKKVFDAELIYGPVFRDDGSFMHSEVKIDDSSIMIGEPPPNQKLMPACIFLSINDAKTVYEKAISENGNPLVEPGQEGSPYYGGVEDSWGNQWWIADK
jgi:uncharacterized glyoxalase superfamily protein PhnB